MGAFLDLGSDGGWADERDTLCSERKRSRCGGIRANSNKGKVLEQPVIKGKATIKMSLIYQREQGVVSWNREGGALEEMNGNGQKI